jgi:hypothetical protein
MVQYQLKPQPADKRNVSQADILNNFTYLQASVGADHNFTNLNPSTNDGLHTKSTYYVTGDPATTLTQVAAYAKADGAGRTQLWLRPQNNGTAIQLTATSTTGGTVPTAALRGATFLPGGLLLQWGKEASTGAVVFPVQFGAAFAPTVTFSVTGSVGNNVPIISVVPSATGFTVVPAGPANLFWIAVGPA